ncbi:hypothetical protein ACFSQD_17120 [Flavihumibacter stibioxidans]|uniref:DUF3575 domain-containing protein n=1 Tax=Flavihumibacter stibioxidans TaxID=1834163 RepID=A0ABR7MCU8_9BACT|nr:hypothetical protein [Flavihumibacter stibioxidans]MBC6492856.1 hypothetical protein [Flavihumibacter stibioxidans]
MKRLALIVLLAGFAVELNAQQMGDFISLKKPNNRHVSSYFKGSRIDFQHVNGQRIDGYVEAVRNDSVFVRQWQIMTFMTNLGTTRVDTVGYFIHGLHYQEIFSIFPDRKESWRFVKNGSIFMIGGAGYILLNVVNGIYREEPLDDPENLRSMGIAAGVAAGGFVLNRIYRNKVRKGKHYKIVYIKMTDR